METKKNKNLIEAKKNKNDEFYTYYEDVANELKWYADQLKGKAILCPCDYDFYKEFSEAERNKIFNGEMTDKNDIGSFSRYLYNKQDAGWNNILYFSHYNSKTKEGIPFQQSIREFAKKHPDGIVITNPPFSCYSFDTEVKTNNGWKLFKDVKDTDLILSLNPDTNEMEYVKFKEKLVNHYYGDLLHFNNAGMDLMVTPNHKMFSYAKNKNNKYEYKGLIPAENVKKTYLLKNKGFKYKGERKDVFVLPSVEQLEQYTRKPITIPNKEIDMKAFLEFFGFWLADGCWIIKKNVNNTTTYITSIKQHINNVDYVIKLIENIGFTPKVYYNKNSSTANIDINSKQLTVWLQQFGRSRDKFIPEEFMNLDKDYLEVLFKGYHNGDGEKRLIRGKSTIYKFQSVSLKLITNIQELILKIYGRTTKIISRDIKYKNQPYMFYIIQFVPDSKEMNYTRYGEPKLVPYNENVYCLTLEKNHIMLVKRNNKIAWSGNSFREFMEILQETNLKFLIMGHKNSVAKKEIFRLFKENKMWFGYSMPKDFKQPNGDNIKSVKGAIKWFTNLDVKPRKETMSLTYSYYDNPELYPKYDNYDAINVDKTKMIPYDYDGYMGVPITFLEKYNPEQFEIVCASFEIKDNPNFQFLKINDENFIKTINKFDAGYIKGQRLYARIIIKNKQPEEY